MSDKNILCLVCMVVCLCGQNLRAQGKAGANVITFHGIWQDFLSQYRSLEGSLNFTTSTTLLDNQNIHVDEMYADIRSMSMAPWVWNFGVGYTFRPFRPVSVGLRLDFRPIQYTRLDAPFQEFMNWSLNTSWDIGDILQVIVQLQDNNEWNINAAQNTFGRLLSVARSEGDSATAMGEVTYKKENRIFLQLRPVKTLTPLEPSFRVNVVSSTATYPLTALDANAGVRQRDTQLNILGLGGSLVLRVDPFEAGLSYNQAPANLVKNVYYVQNFLQQTWNTYIQFRLDRYATFRAGLTYFRSLNRSGSLYQTSGWTFLEQEQSAPARLASGYFAENNQNGTTIHLSLTLR